ncbi:MAG: sodium:calcium antiporter, partial [Mycoplasmatales bacterium]
VYCAVQLSKQAEVIEANSKINVLLIGAILALATSLPELATGITSAFIGQADMSVSNVLGSNIFNLLILAVMNIAFYKRVINHHIQDQTNKFSIVVIGMYIVFIIGLFASKTGALNVLNFDLTSVFIVVIYFVGIKIINSKDIESHAEQNQNADAKMLKKATLKFLLFAGFVLFASIFLSLKAEEIMTLSGLSASFVGAIFIGISTSLPELVTTITLVKHQHYNLAAAGILGSNLFNFTILSIVDFSSNASVYSFSKGVLLLAILGLFFSVLMYIAIKFSKNNKNMNLLVPVIIVIGYFWFLLSGGN